MRICKDCQHYQAEPDGNPTCGAARSLVSGEFLNPRCYDARDDKGQCGPEALLFKETDEISSKRAAEARERLRRGPPVDFMIDQEPLSRGNRVDTKRGRSDG